MAARASSRLLLGAIWAQRDVRASPVSMEPTHWAPVLLSCCGMTRLFRAADAGRPQTAQARGSQGRCPRPHTDVYSPLPLHQAATCTHRKAAMAASSRTCGTWRARSRACCWQRALWTRPTTAAATRSCRALQMRCVIFLRRLGGLPAKRASGGSYRLMHSTRSQRLPQSLAP
jgi:hypothetical protein